MEFNNKLYELRKSKGFSQEELASRLNVSRQTVSKWEVGDSTPDMEKLIAISVLFGISLDELILNKVPVQSAETPAKSDGVNEIMQKVLTDDNKKKVKKGFRLAAIIFGILLAADVISMVIYVSLNGFPK